MKTKIKNLSIFIIFLFVIFNTQKLVAAQIINDTIKLNNLAPNNGNYLFLKNIRNFYVYEFVNTDTLEDISEATATTSSQDVEDSESSYVFYILQFDKQTNWIIVNYGNKYENIEYFLESQSCSSINDNNLQKVKDILKSGDICVFLNYFKNFSLQFSGLDIANISNIIITEENTKSKIPLPKLQKKYKVTFIGSLNTTNEVNNDKILSFTITGKYKLKEIKDILKVLDLHNIDFDKNKSFGIFKKFKNLFSNGFFKKVQDKLKGLLSK